MPSCSRARRRLVTPVAVSATLGLLLLFLAALFASCYLSTSSARDRAAGYGGSLGTCFRWSASQLVTSLTPPCLGGLERRALGWAKTAEEEAWSEWESALAFVDDHDDGSLFGGVDDDSVGGTGPSSVRRRLNPREVPSLDVSDISGLIERCRSIEPSLESTFLTPSCVAFLLGDPGWRSRPLLLNSLWNASSLESPARTLSLSGLASDPLLNGLEVPYYGDASGSGYGALKPSGRATLGEVLDNITTGKNGGRQKVGSQLVIEARPELIEEVAPAEIVKELFGDRFKAEDVRGSGPLGMFPAATTVPIFLAEVDGPVVEDAGAVGVCHGLEQDASAKNCELEREVVGEKRLADRERASVKNDLLIPPAALGVCKPQLHARTDLHSEPIASLSVQLTSSKTWTLVSPSRSFALRPSVSKRGRAFFYSNLDPLNEDDALRLETVERYAAVTNAGDGLWVPPWWWHRVDYCIEAATDSASEGNGGTPGSEKATATGTQYDTSGSSNRMARRRKRDISLAASLFHFRPAEFVTYQPLFATLIVPNLVKELMGQKVE